MSRKLESEGGLPHQTVRHWGDLGKLPPSNTHYLEIHVEACHGRIRPKADDEALGDYLSTHTFYGSNHQHSTKLMRKRGFNVTMENWDKQEDKL